MAININLKTIFASDPQELVTDKLNYNYQRLLELGVGLRGPQGQPGTPGQGIPGPIGAQGTRGSVILTGLGQPTTTVPSYLTQYMQGDNYWDTQNLYLYEYESTDPTNPSASGYWLGVMDLKGYIVQSVTNLADEAFTKVHPEEPAMQSKEITFRGNSTYDGSGTDLDALNPQLILANFEILTTSASSDGLANLTDSSDIDTYVYGNVGSNKTGGILALYSDHYLYPTNAGTLKSPLLIGSAYKRNDGLSHTTDRLISTADESLKIRFEMQYDSSLTRYCSVSKIITGPGYDDILTVNSYIDNDSSLLTRSMVNVTYDGIKPIVSLATGSKYSMKNSFITSHGSALTPYHGMRAAYENAGIPRVIGLGLMSSYDVSGSGTPSYSFYDSIGSSLYFNQGNFYVQRMPEAGGTANNILALTAGGNLVISSLQDGVTPTTGGNLTLQASAGVTSSTGGSVLINGGNSTGTGGSVYVAPGGSGSAAGLISLNGVTLINATSQIAADYKLQVSGTSLLDGTVLVNSTALLTVDTSYKMQVGGSIITNGQNVTLGNATTNTLSLLGTGNSNIAFAGSNDNNAIYTEVNSTTQKGMNLSVYTATATDGTYYSTGLGNPGGDFSIQSGTGSQLTGVGVTEVCGRGGNLTISTGSGGSHITGTPNANTAGAGGAGGNLSISIGSGGNGDTENGLSGSTGAYSYGGAGGSVSLTAGAGGTGGYGSSHYAHGGAGGSITLSAGNGGAASTTALAGAGGSFTFNCGTGGNSDTNPNGGTGGSYTINLGAPGTGGTLAGIFNVNYQSNSYLTVSNTQVTIGYGTTYVYPNLPATAVSPDYTLGVQNGKIVKSSSSKKYKENIVPVGATDSDVIYSMNPVTFNYIGQPERSNVGLIAEDIDLIYKSAVIYDKGGKPDNVNYQSIFSLMLAAMKNLKAENDQLKADIAAIKAKIGM